MLFRLVIVLFIAHFLSCGDRVAVRDSEIRQFLKLSTRHAESLAEKLPTVRDENEAIVLMQQLVKKLREISKEFAILKERYPELQDLNFRINMFQTMPNEMHDFAKSIQRMEAEGARFDRKFSASSELKLLKEEARKLMRGLI